MHHDSSLVAQASGGALLWTRVVACGLIGLVCGAFAGLLGAARADRSENIGFVSGAILGAIAGAIAGLAAFRQ